MDKEQANEMIMQEFLSDNLLYQDISGNYYGFDRILHQSILQVTTECFKGIIISLDWGNIRIWEYILDKGEFTSKGEITVSQEDVRRTAEKLYRIA